MRLENNQLTGKISFSMKDFIDNNDFRFSQQSKNFVSSLNFAPGIPFGDYKSSTTFSMPSRTLLEKNAKVWYSSPKFSAIWSSKGGEFNIPAFLTQSPCFPGLPSCSLYPGLFPRGTNTSQQERLKLWTPGRAEPLKSHVQLSSEQVYVLNDSETLPAPFPSDLYILPWYFPTYSQETGPPSCVAVPEQNKAMKKIKIWDSWLFMEKQKEQLIRAWRTGKYQKEGCYYLHGLKNPQKHEK